jgi:trehalose-6-phosphate synthase
LTKTRLKKTLLNVRVNDRFAIVARHNEQDLSKIIIQNHKYVVKNMLILQQIRKRAMHEREIMFMLHRHFVSNDQFRALQKLV